MCHSIFFGLLQEFIFKATDARSNSASTQWENISGVPTLLDVGVAKSHQAHNTILVK
jgi:hypothetical protein